MRSNAEALTPPLPASRERLLLTLLFLNAVGLQRTWDLRGCANRLLETTGNSGG